MTEHIVTQWETVEQVRSRLHISRQTLYRYLEDGLPCHQPGGEKGTRLFDPVEVDMWIRSRCSDRTPAAVVAA